MTAKPYTEPDWISEKQELFIRELQIRIVEHLARQRMTRAELRRVIGNHGLLPVAINRLLTCKHDAQDDHYCPNLHFIEEIKLPPRTTASGRRVRGGSAFKLRVEMGADDGPARALRSLRFVQMIRAQQRNRLT